MLLANASVKTVEKLIGWLKAGLTAHQGKISNREELPSLSYSFQSDPTRHDFGVSALPVGEGVEQRNKKAGFLLLLFTRRVSKKRGT